LLPGAGDEEEPDARLKKLSFAKSAERSAKASRKTKAKKGMGEDNVATDM